MSGSAHVQFGFYYVMSQLMLCLAHSTLHMLPVHTVHVASGKKDLEDILIACMFLNDLESILIFIKVTDSLN